MSPPIPSYSLDCWTRVFAATLVRLYPATQLADALAIAHGRFFVDDGLQPVQAAELYALSEGSPVQRRGQIPQQRSTFRNLTERFMNAPPGEDAFVQLQKDAIDLLEVDPGNAAIYTGVQLIAARYLPRLGSMSTEETRAAKEQVLRACFRLVVALTCDLALRARTLREVLAEFDVPG